jgi:hypothetical protein
LGCCRGWRFLDFTSLRSVPLGMTGKRVSAALRSARNDRNPRRPSAKRRSRFFFGAGPPAATGGGVSPRRASAPTEEVLEFSKISGFCPFCPQGFGGFHVMYSKRDRQRDG